MKVNKHLSRFLQLAEVQRAGGAVVYTIQGYAEETLRDPKTGQESIKPVLLLDEDRALPCNKTNLQTLVSLFNSDDSDDWVGEQIEIYVDMTVSFGGQQKGGLRLRKPSDSNFPPPDEDQNVPPAPEPAAVAVTVTSRRSRSRG